MRYRLWMAIGVGLAMATAAATGWAAAKTYKGFQVVNVVVNGQPLISDVPAIMVDGRTMLPIRAVAEAMGAEVGWDAETSTVKLWTAEAEALKRELGDALAKLDSLQAELAAAKTKLSIAERDLISVRANATEGRGAAESAAGKGEGATGTSAESVEKTSGRIVTPKFTDPQDLRIWLNNNYDAVETPVGPLPLTYNIFVNQHSNKPHDFWVWLNFPPGRSQEREHFFYDLRYNIKITDSQRKATIRALRQHAQIVYAIIAASFPDKKVEGTYITTWYDYPHSQVGFHSNSYLGWRNFTIDKLGPGDHDNIYSKSHITGFHFEPTLDDYDFRDWLQANN